MAVPNIFGSATAAIPLSQLDQNFATAITLGNTAVYLGNTTTSLGNVTLTNVTISSGTSNIAANVSTAVGLLPEAQGGTGTTTGYYGFKNRIINGAMVIDQRNAGAAVTANASYPVDRFVVAINSGSQSVQRSTTVPAGFLNSLEWTVTTGGAPSAATQNSIRQPIEGFNVSDLDFGLASAATVTLSFWVRSSVTGTFSGSVMNGAYNRSYVYTYTISSANTWEYKTITIAGDTSGTWAKDNTAGMRINFDTGSGSNFNGTAGAWNAGEYYRASGANSIAGTTGATFYITGVQLEKGSTATSFDYRPYGTELQLCQRYFIQLLSGTIKTIGIGFTYNTTEIDATVSLPVTMRGTPTLTQVTGTNYYILAGTPNKSFNGFTAVQSFSGNYINFYVTGLSGMTGGQAGVLVSSDSSAYIGLAAEL